MPREMNYRPLCDKTSTATKFMLTTRSKNADRAIATPTPAVPWLVGSSPFFGTSYTQVWVQTLLLESWELCFSCLISSCLRLRYKAVSLFLRRVKSSSLLQQKEYFGTRSDKSGLKINAQPPPEGETEDYADSCAAAAASYRTTCLGVNNQVSRARRGQSRHKPTLMMDQRLDLTRRSIRTVVSSEA